MQPSTSLKKISLTPKTPFVIINNTMEEIYSTVLEKPLIKCNADYDVGVTVLLYGNLKEVGPKKDVL